jgi:AcrR family transcriptional regulator
MSETVNGGRQTDLYRERRRQIFEAAAKVFAAKGYYDATVSEIAQEAGLGKGTIYEYVKSKKELLRLVIEEGHDRMLDQLDIVVEMDLAPEEKFRRAAGIMLSIMDEYSEAAKTLMPEIFGLELTDREFVDKLKNRYISRMQRLYDEGAATGVFKELDSYLVSEIILNMVGLWGKSDTVRSCSGDSTEIFEEFIMSIFFKGILK